jgi:hypothetical protein
MPLRAQLSRGLGLSNGRGGISSPFVTKGPVRRGGLLSPNGLGAQLRVSRLAARHLGPAAQRRETRLLQRRAIRPAPRQREAPGCER